MTSPVPVPPKQVLLVEDDPALRKLVKGFLQVAGFGVVEAFDGRRAMTFLKEQRFDLIVLDLMLPESSGYDVLDFIKREVPHKSPILMVSARGLPEDRAQAEELGASMYLIKPFTRGEFTRAIKQLTESSPK